MDTIPFPRTLDEYHTPEIVHARKTADFSESDLLEVCDDPTAETRIFALGHLGLVRGDDERVLPILRSELAKAIDAHDPVLQGICAVALAQRFGRDALPDLRRLWESKIKRNVRTQLLAWFGALGVTDYYDEALTLFRRGLKQHRQYSGGIEMMTLGTYLLQCAQHGVGNSLDVKALIRERPVPKRLTPDEFRAKLIQEKKVPERLIPKNLNPDNFVDGMACQWEQMMPGITDESVPLAEVPDPIFHAPT